MTRATVSAVRHLSSDVRALHLTPSDVVSFQPGQHLLVGVWGGPSRCYSMARPPRADGSIELHVKRWPGGAFSDRVVERLKPGDLVELAGPFGEFTFPDGDGPVVMLATGTGIAPFQAMLEAHLPFGPGRPITLFWGGRSGDDFYISEQLDAWQAEYPNFRFVRVLSTLGEGYVQDVARRQIRDLSTTSVLACGTPAMIEAARRYFITEADLQAAHFAADPFDAADTALILTNMDVGTDAPITLSVNGARLSVAPGTSLLAALRAAGQPVLSVCGGKASCGTCLVRLAPEWLERVGLPAKTERNLLACLPDISPTDRLACQISLSPRLDGLALSLPVSA